MSSVNNSLVKPQETISTYFLKPLVKQKVVEMVGSTDSQRFMTSIISAVSNTPGLQECEYGSIVSAALLGETLKLSPSPQLGHYYMVPFRVKTGRKDEKGQDIYIKKAQFQMGYKGYVQLAIRSGKYKKINVLAIKEGELIKYDPLTEDLEVNLIEDDEIRENTPTIGYYAMFEYHEGFRKTLYWSKKKMLAHADKYSPAFDKEIYKKIQDGQIPQKDLWKYSSFWYKDFDGMAYKTMLRQLISKWGIMSIDMQEAYTKDMAEIKENGEFEYIDSPTDNDMDPVITAEVTETEYETPSDTEVVPQIENIEEASVQPEEKQEAKKIKSASKKETKVENTIPPDEMGNEYFEDDPFAIL